MNQSKSELTIHDGKGRPRRVQRDLIFLRCAIAIAILLLFGLRISAPSFFNWYSKIWIWQHAWREQMLISGMAIASWGIWDLWSKQQADPNFAENHEIPRASVQIVSSTMLDVIMIVGGIASAIRALLK